MRAKLTVRVTCQLDDAPISVLVLDSAGQVAGKASGSGGPRGTEIDLPLFVELLADDADVPRRTPPGGPELLDRIADRLDEQHLRQSAIGMDASTDLIAECVRAISETRECVRLVAEARKDARAMDVHEMEDDPDSVRRDLDRAHDALARRLARIEHLEARHAERAARVSGEPRATGRD